MRQIFKSGGTGVRISADVTDDLDQVSSWVFCNLSRSYVVQRLETSKVCMYLYTLQIIHNSFYDVTLPNLSY